MRALVPGAIGKEWPAKSEKPPCKELLGVACEPTYDS